MNRNEAIQHLNSVRKVELPPTEELPTRSGMSFTPSYNTSVRTRQDISTASQEVVAPKPVTERERLMKLYGDLYEKKQAEEKAETTRRQRIAAEKRRVDEAHRLDDLRIAEAKVERNRIVLDNITKAEIRGILADATAPEIESVLKKVREWKMEKQSFAYGIALKEMREAAKK